jgi:hypothetical protein
MLNRSSGGVEKCSVKNERGCLVQTCGESGVSIVVQRFLNLDDIYPSLTTFWPIHILISVFEFFCDVLTAELSI